ncbi:MAG: RsmD family RNA methyltransferase, partial [Patescibacteria group bacterium]
MSQYIFILGNNPELSQAEIISVLPQAKTLSKDREFLVLENDEMDTKELMDKLGGTVKIGKVLGREINESQILEIASSLPSDKRFNFGFSFYRMKPVNPGLRIKKILKEKNVRSRLVVSREPVLSSVIVTKEKCHDFLVLPGYFGLTAAVQDFKDYGLKDFGRPASDPYSGMLPPKVAKMMINLLGLDLKEKTLLDPFCGSGTVLAEAIILGSKKVIGLDISAKAVSDAKENIAWTLKTFALNTQVRIEQSDVKNLSQKAERIDAIVTEPYLGPAIRGGEDISAIRKELVKL